jgi:hypothetical protein
VFDGLNLLHLHVEIARIFKDVAQQVGTLRKIAGEFGEKLEKTWFVWN